MVVYLCSFVVEKTKVQRGFDNLPMGMQPVDDMGGLGFEGLGPGGPHPSSVADVYLRKERGVGRAFGCG